MAVVEGVWQWEFAAPPDALWPLLADTARFNEAAGLMRYEVADTTLPDGTVRHTGTANILGRTISWEEGVPQWVAGRSYAHQRFFHGGPLRRMRAAIDIEPVASGGATVEPMASRVRYRLQFEPRWALLSPLLRRFFSRFGQTLDRLFRQAAGFAEGSRARAYEVAAPSIDATARRRVDERTKALAEAGHGEAERLAGFLLEAPESDLERMRPRVFARRWQVEPRLAIETFLAAARGGLLALRWDLVCPRCRGAKVVASGLDELPEGAHCPSCDVDYGRDFARNVEVTFEPAEDIRKLGGGTFCLASPLAAEHVKVQWQLAPGETQAIDANLPDGDYRARTVEPGDELDFKIAGGTIPPITLADGSVAFGLDAPQTQLVARNDGATPRTLVIEDRRWATDALTAHEVTTLQAFRDMFADSVLRPGDQVEIRHITFLFSDLRGSSDLYNRVGDARAYGLVREHFAVLTRAVRASDGAVVKTIGDAVMAAFSDANHALAAALRIRDDIDAFNRDMAGELDGAETAMIVRLGLHCGPCIAVTLNDRLDYFGRAVNLAARLEPQSSGDDIVLSEAMAAEPGVAETLDELGATAENAEIKGFAEPVALRRIPARRTLAAKADAIPPGGE